MKIEIKYMYSNFKSKLFDFFLYLWIVYSKKDIIFKILRQVWLVIWWPLSLLNAISSSNYILLLKSLNMDMAYHQLFFFYWKVNFPGNNKFANFSFQWKYSENKTTVAQLIQDGTQYLRLSGQTIIVVCLSVGSTHFVHYSGTRNQCFFFARARC